VFTEGASGKERLQSVLKSDYASSLSEFNGKTAMVVDDKGRYTLLYSDFTNYVNQQYMNARVIDAFFYLLSQTYDNVIFGDSTIYQSMVLNFYPDDQLREIMKRRWPDSIDVMYFPININDNHWILVVANKKKRVMDVYDSLKFKNGKETKLLSTKLSMVFSNGAPWKVNDNSKEWNIHRQQDHHSCAFFTCWYAYELATGGSVGIWPTDLDWKMRVKVIAQQVFISLVSKKIKMKNLFVDTVYHKFT